MTEIRIRMLICRVLAWLWHVAKGHKEYPTRQGDREREE